MWFRWQLRNILMYFYVYNVEQVHSVLCKCANLVLFTYIAGE